MSCTTHPEGVHWQSSPPALHPFTIHVAMGQHTKAPVNSHYWLLTPWKEEEEEEEKSQTSTCFSTELSLNVCRRWKQHIILLSTPVKKHYFCYKLGRKMPFILEHVVNIYLDLLSKCNQINSTGKCCKDFSASQNSHIKLLWFCLPVKFREKKEK